MTSIATFALLLMSTIFILIVAAIATGFPPHPAAERTQKRAGLRLVDDHPAPAKYESAPLPAKKVA